MSATLVQATAADYGRIFEAERAVSYPLVDAYEKRLGFALDRAKLEDAARVLACPLKAHAPNWHHGRVLYAAARWYLSARFQPVVILDIGTAKGFSALCLQWALTDAGMIGQVMSVDVIDPTDRVRRNTVAELDGYKTLRETLEPWPESEQIAFVCSTGETAIRKFTRVHIAYVDGKHTFDAVSAEAALLADRQEPGDLVVFDDAQIDGVARAIAGASKHYTMDYLDVLPERKYAVGVRRG